MTASKISDIVVYEAMVSDDNIVRMNLFSKNKGSYVDVAMNEYINSFNKIYSKTIPPHKKPLNFFMVFHSPINLISSRHYNFAQDLLTRKELIVCRKNKDGEEMEAGLYSMTDAPENLGNKPFLPIVHFTLGDILKNYATGEDRYIAAIAEMSPKFKTIIDSSIWNYYVPIELERDSYNFIRLEYAIKQMVEYATKNNVNLYNLSITREYADLNARLVRASYLNGAKAAHETFVSPFLFHSEWDFKKRLSVALSEEQSLFFETRWRILLVDDHANKGLTCYSNPLKEESEDEQKKNLCPSGKLQILINNILTNKIKKRIVWNCPTSKDIEELKLDDWHKYGDDWDLKDFDLAIICVRSVQDARNLIKYTKFDIILLDYLLGWKTSSHREYGYELLTKIERKIDENKKRQDKLYHEELKFIGPMGKYCLMFISAFVPAISEQLQKLGLLRDTKYWHIARGACPTNTPNLFTYYLYCLMKKRYLEMGFDNDSDMRGYTLIDLLYVIFLPEFSQIKWRATTYFNTLLNLRSKYDVLKYDTLKEDFEEDNWLNRRGSLLVYSLFPDIQYYSNSFWEHMQQLIYLVAYGTSRQWPEMWEEYMFVRDRIKNAEEDVKVMYKKRPNFIGQMPSEQIEKYIIHLKNA